MKTRVIIYDMYHRFVEKFYSLDQQVNGYSESADITITDFLLELHKSVGLQSIGPRYIYRYLTFQFDYWSNKSVRFGDRITIKRVFGKKPLERFRNISESFSWYNAQLNMSSYGIEPTMINRYSSKKLKNFKQLDPQEELEKARHLNQDEGFRNCIDGTTLYNHRSPNCAVCKSNVLCRKVLKQNYIGIYIDRGYDR